MLSKSRANANSRLLALTLARRSMKRNLLQSALIILVIAMPVAAGAFGLVYNESTKPNAAESVEMSLGKTQARLHADARPDLNNYQVPTEGEAFQFTRDGSWVEPDQGAAMVDPRTLLTGYKWIPERIDTATVKTASGQGNITLVEGEAWNPELEGRFFDLVGNAPKNDHEIMVNKQALERLGVAIGDNVTLVQSGDSFKVVGTLEFVKAARNASVVYAMPGSISSVPVALESYSFYAIGDKAVEWSQIDAMNKQGVGVLSRAVILNPPADSEVPLYQAGWYNQGGFLTILSQLLALIFLVPLVLLPVAVLAGSAFSFGARRQAKTLAVISSLGANAKLLRFITVANGLWLGLLGGILGVAIGTAAAAIGLPLLTNGSRVAYPGFHLPFLLLLIAGLSGAIIGAIVSLVPAYAAAKVDVLSTLRGIRASAKVQKKSGIGGLVTLAAGAAISLGALFGVQYLTEAIRTNAIDPMTGFSVMPMLLLAIACGSAVMIIGLLIGSGWLLILARTVFKGLGTAANYATNDLIYNRKRYTSVIASVLATSFVGATVLTMFFSFGEYGRENYKPNGEVNQLTYDAASIGWSMSEANDLELLKARYENRETVLDDTIITANNIAPAKSANVIQMHRQYSSFTMSLPIGAEGQQPYVAPNPKMLCPWMEGSAYFDEFQVMQNEQDYVAQGELTSRPELQGCDQLANPTGQFVVATPQEFRALMGGRVDNQAEAALAAGGAVVFHPGLLENGKMKIQWFDSGVDTALFGQAPYGPDGMPLLGKDGLPFELGEPSKVAEVDAVVSKSNNYMMSKVLSPQAAEKLGIDYSPWLAVVNFADKLGFAQTDALAANITEGYMYEAGYSVDTEFIAWIITAAVAFFILASTSIALGLAQIESRADQSTLGSIGAPKRFRANVLGGQALVLTGFGTLLGSGIGIFLAWAITSAAGGTTGIEMFHLPIAQTVTVVAGIPLVAGLLFWLGTPARSTFKARLSID
jgi:ABC-type lipoprotein release transport system permease subunit